MYCEKNVSKNIIFSNYVKKFMDMFSSSTAQLLRYYLLLSFGVVSKIHDLSIKAIKYPFLFPLPVWVWIFFIYFNQDSILFTTWYAEAGLWFQLSSLKPDLRDICKDVKQHHSSHEIFLVLESSFFFFSIKIYFNW